MFLPRKWAWGLALLAAVPGLANAGPFDAADSGQPAAAAAPARTNQKVAEDIAQSLQKAKLEYSGVRIEYQNGVAKITGKIATSEQFSQVSRLIAAVPGVTGVDNRMEVVQAAAQPAAAPAATPPAAAPVAAAPFPGQSPAQPFPVPAAEAAPLVKAPAAAPLARQAAAPAPQQVAPVSFDQAPTQNNQQVAQNIAKALQSAGLSGYDVEIRYKDGAASLIGSVGNPQQAQQAERVVRQVPGVQQVLNRLTVQGQPAVQPAGYNPQQGYPVQQVQGVNPQLAAPPGVPPQMAQGMPPQMAPQMAPVPAQGLPAYGHVQPASHLTYNQPNVPPYAWPSYAPYDNSAAISYPTQYDASAWPYIGPYYPYPQVPLGWRKSTLEWDDGYWSLKFDSKTDRWWWFLNPHNWD